jgi:hypothetical protein
MVSPDRADFFREDPDCDLSRFPSAPWCAVWFTAHLEGGCRLVHIDWNQAGTYLFWVCQDYLYGSRSSSPCSGTVSTKELYQCFVAGCDFAGRMSEGLWPFYLRRRQTVGHSFPRASAQVGFTDALIRIHGLTLSSQPSQELSYERRQSRGAFIIWGIMGYHVFDLILPPQFEGPDIIGGNDPTARSGRAVLLLQVMPAQSSLTTPCC